MRRAVVVSGVVLSGIAVVASASGDAPLQGNVVVACPDLSYTFPASGPVTSSFHQGTKPGAVVNNGMLLCMSEGTFKAQRSDCGHDPLQSNCSGQMTTDCTKLGLAPPTTAPPAPSGWTTMLWHTAPPVGGYSPPTRSCESAPTYWRVTRSIGKEFTSCTVAPNGTSFNCVAR